MITGEIIPGTVWAVDWGAKDVSVLTTATTAATSLTSVSPTASDINKMIKDMYFNMKADKSDRVNWANALLRQSTFNNIPDDGRMVPKLNRKLLLLEG